MLDKKIRKTTEKFTKSQPTSHSNTHMQRYKHTHNNTSLKHKEVQLRIQHKQFDLPLPKIHNKLYGSQTFTYKIGPCLKRKRNSETETWPWPKEHRRQQRGRVRHCRQMENTENIWRGKQMKGAEWKLLVLSHSSNLKTRSGVERQDQSLLTACNDHTHAPL